MVLCLAAVALAVLAGPAASQLAKDGGAITISQSSQPDFLDPALSYTVNGWEPMWLVYTPLLTYEHTEGVAGSRLIPGLAQALPTISRGGRRYELALRPGLLYSDGTPVKASDFEYAIKRVLAMNSGGAAFYLVIKGAQRYVNTGNANGDISGIATDDATGRITIDLVTPDASFSYELSMLLAAPVPAGTPFRDMTRSPPPGVGPYRITSSVPNSQFVLERVPSFNVPGIPKGHVDRITTRIIESAATQAEMVINDQLDYMQDPPPASFKRRIKARYGDRYEEHPTASTYYMFMNTRRAPFNDPRVRRAVNYGVDKRALARIFAGELEPGCSFLPPGVPGYDERIDRRRCPWGDPSGPPKLAKARRLVRQAGATGVRVTVWGNDDEPTDVLTMVYARQLRRIGLDARPKIIRGSAYFRTIGDARVRPQTGFANWFQDFPHPYNFFFLVDGRSIQATNNQNFGNVNDRGIDRALRALAREPELTPGVAGRWARLNRQLVRSGYILPYGHRTLSTFMSERMDIEHCSVFHPVFINDYSSFCLK